MIESSGSGAGARTPRRSPRACPWPAAVAAALLAAVSTACGEAGDASAEAVPDSFVVAFETSKGDFRVRFRRHWSPQAVDRVHELARARHWAGARFYRVNPAYAQFGYAGRPALDSVWVGRGLPDELPHASNVRGTVSFARGGPASRSSILFVNRTDNSNLDRLEWNGVLGFPPVGEIESGMEAVDALYDGYGDDPMQWEDSIAAAGNAFLDRRYPLLDSIIDVRIVENWR